jgi:hypothetical protein
VALIAFAVTIRSNSIVGPWLFLESPAVNLNRQKEQFSIAYVRAVVAAAGYNVYKQEVDDESVDLGVAASGLNGTMKSPRLDLQLKCSETIVLDDSDFGFWLKLKNYDDLRDPDVHVPRLIVVVHVPDNVDEWISHDESRMALRRCGYWHSLAGMPSTDNSTGQTIRLSRSRRFDVAGLKYLMAQVANKRRP